MALFSLVRRRLVWVPTLTGWLVLITFAGAISVLAVRLIHPFLAPTAPAPGARLLVIEGWLDMTELDQAIAMVRQGRYERVVTTGGPIERWAELSVSSNYADLAASYLRTHGLENFPVAAITAPASAQDRTFLSAVKLREWVKGQGLAPGALDVFSGGTHGRRTRMLYRMAFGADVDVGVLSARPSQYDEERWWRTSVGVKSVLGETVSVAWTACCFYPPPPGSHEELWAVPRQRR
jgi:hypothetical protein